MGASARTPPSLTPRVRRTISVLKRAEHDLLALSPADREAMVTAIEALATEPAPRGALALHDRAEGHVQRRVGRLRLLYAVRGEAVIVVAVTRGPA